MHTSQMVTCVLQVCYGGETPEGIANLVDMSADEVNDILRGNERIQAAQTCNVIQATEETCRQLQAALQPGQTALLIGCINSVLPIFGHRRCDLHACSS